MLQLVLVFICPIVLTIVALYLKKNIKTDIGKSGYITKKSIESEETWIYAQIVAPNIYLKTAVICLVIDILVILLLIGNNEYNMIIKISNCIGFVFVFLPFFGIDNKIEEFQKNFLDKEDKKYESVKWIKLVKFLIREKNFSKLKIALNSSAWKNLLNEKRVEL